MSPPSSPGCTPEQAKSVGSTGEGRKLEAGLLGSPGRQRPLNSNRQPSFSKPMGNAQARRGSMGAMQLPSSLPIGAPFEHRKSELLLAPKMDAAAMDARRRSLSVKGARERRQSCPAVRDRSERRAGIVAAPQAVATAAAEPVPLLAVSLGRGLSAQVDTSKHCLFYQNVCKIAERLQLSNKEKEGAQTMEVPSDAGAKLRALKGQTTHEESIMAGKRILAIRTDGLKVQQHAMIGDGNCLFRSVSYQLYGTQDRHPEVRQQCVEQLAAERAQYSLYYDTEEEFDKYVENMTQPCTWGDEIALKAMCDKLKFVAYVLTSTMGAWYLRYAPNGMELPEYSKIRHIFLAYLYPIHWDTLRYLDGSEIVLSPEEVESLPDLVSDTRHVIVSQN